MKLRTNHQHCVGFKEGKLYICIFMHISVLHNAQCFICSSQNFRSPQDLAEDWVDQLLPLVYLLSSCSMLQFFCILSIPIIICTMTLASCPSLWLAHSPCLAWRKRKHMDISLWENSMGCSNPNVFCCRTLKQIPVTPWHVFVERLLSAWKRNHILAVNIYIF